MDVVQWGIRTFGLLINWKSGERELQRRGKEVNGRTHFSVSSISLRWGDMWVEPTGEGYGGRGTHLIRFGLVDGNSVSGPKANTGSRARRDNGKTHLAAGS